MRVDGKSEQLLSSRQLLVIDQQIPGQVSGSDDSKPRSHARVAEEVGMGAEPAEGVIGPIQRLADGTNDGQLWYAARV